MDKTLTSIGNGAQTPTRVPNASPKAPVKVKTDSAAANPAPAESTAASGKLGIDEATGTVFYQKIKDNRVVSQTPDARQLKLKAAAKEVADEILGQMLDTKA